MPLMFESKAEEMQGMRQEQFRTMRRISTAMNRPANFTAWSFTTSTLINTHQHSSTLINTHQHSSTLINTHQHSSTLINTHQHSSTLINTHQHS
ncbi:hypothetical protein N7478_001408 [Penicillium angulare]|uniref:uncharacterized protein n=1 Tax=Penicillium angulare TaxID=116970 RepID=UPI002541849A|nr:uncharacterized protein N7478_001408 [Penicillium angulare]KAJ5292157.1 hypothetical protein N7478_001408 [Penicillium angulare]